MLQKVCTAAGGNMNQVINRQKLVLYIGHPFDLAFFKRLIPLINDDNQYYIITIVAKGYYFREMNNLEDILSTIANENIIISDNKIPGYSKNIFRTLYRTLCVRKLIHGVDKKNSILISIDKSQFIANYLNSHFKKVILIQTVDTLDLKKDYKPAYLKMAWSNLINIITGSKLIFLRYNKKSSGHIWHYKILNPNFKVIYRNDNISISNRIVLPGVKSKNKSKKIVIFGNRYNGWEFIKNKKSEVKELIFLFYKNLKQTHPEHTFYYKPHPLEKGTEFAEINHIFDSRLIDVGISLNSELFLIENNDIEYCFSLGSTSSMSAHEMGFSSKVFYKMLPLAQSVNSAYDDIFQDAPEEFFIKDYNELITPCIKENIKPELDYLNKMIREYC
jgi:hypothetical protein